ncbi:sensor histidine kinase [Streptomyces sp. HNM0574]|uniref:sensor histidine kinase n=1 Tax=Streptomyces sp. HNM0574 TaxID=2714954 RepID=UPI00146A621A|nr:sensor histidine kinase [Streptomyces sp. HNM0574]NLU68968.1 sensor histidine kinase [Streptomyces sp. HNM0574]
MTQDIQGVLFWCLAAGLLAITVLLFRQRHITSTVRKRNAELTDGLRARDVEVQHLASVRLPALEDSLHQPVPETGLLHPQLVGTEFAYSLEGVVERFSGAVERAQARADASAKAALKTSMRSIQALANEQQMSISEMQNRHHQPDVLQDLLEIDHANSQFGRRAQAIAVLCGSWPGRQRAASALTDVVRGATSRIRDYRRVRIHGQVDIAVVSRAVEPVVLALAELLDNAARHSQPNTQVEVNLQTVHNGACVIIDDAGIGMDGQVAQRATTLLSGQQTVDVTRLDDPPQFGFPVIGVLAARYGFSVSADTRSPYGGVRAVLFLPGELLTHLAPEEPAAPVAASVPAPARGGAAEQQWQAPRQSAPQRQAQHQQAPRAAQRPVAPAAQPAASAPQAPAPRAATGAGAAAGDARPGQGAGDAMATGSTGEKTAGGLPKRRRHTPRQAAGTQSAGAGAGPSGTQSGAQSGMQGGMQPWHVGAPSGAHLGVPSAAQPGGRGAQGTPGTEDAGARSAQETAQRMGAFARGTRSGREARDDEGKPQE